MAAPEQRYARRVARVRWSDWRLIVGLLLVCSSVVAGSRLLAAADNTEPVWVASRDLAGGTVLQASDLEMRRVQLGTSAGAYVAATGASPAGRALGTALSAGELITVSALTDGAPDERLRYVTVPVATFHFPAAVARGQLVDVYVTRTDPGSPPLSDLVLAGARVDGVTAPETALGADGASTGVILAVPEGDVATLVNALHAGAIDLIAVRR